MALVEREQGGRLGSHGTASNHRIVGAPARNPVIRCLPQEAAVGRRIKGHQASGAQEIRFQHSQGIRRRETMGRRKACQHGVRLDQRRRSYDHRLPGAKSPVELRCGRGMMLVPRTHGRHHAARIGDESRHAAVTRARGAHAAGFDGSAPPSLLAGDLSFRPGRRPEAGPGARASPASARARSRPARLASAPRAAPPASSQPRVVSRRELRAARRNPWLFSWYETYHQ